MKLLLRMIVRQITARPLRSLLTFFSIALGVASIVAVRITVATAQEGFEGLTRAGTGSVALEVFSDKGGAFDAALADRVRAVPGVSAAVPVLQRTSTLRTRGRAVALVVIGLDLADPSALIDFDVREGRTIQGSGEALLEFSLARSLQIQPGEEVKLLTRGGLEECVVVGLLAPRSAGAGQGGFLFAPLADVQTLFRENGRVNTIQLHLSPQATQDDVRASVAKVLPPGLSVRVPAARSRMGAETLTPTIKALTFCSALAFVMAAFIILNSFLMNVSERRRLLSTMRALGATRGQIVRLLLGEGLLLGTLGSVVGCALGLGAARLLRTVLELLLWGTLPPLQVSAEPFLLAAILGPGVSLLGSYLPARRASQVSPLEGIRGPLPEEKTPSLRWYSAGGFMLGIIALGIEVGCIWAWLPITAGAPGGVLAVVAAVLLLPRFLPPLERFVARMTTPFLGFEGRLAHVTVLRYQVRSALTVGILFVALCTSFAIGNTLTNNVRDVRRHMRRTVLCDYMIRAYRPNVSADNTSDIPPGLEESVRHIPKTSLEALRLIRVQAAKVQATLIVREFPDPSDLKLDLKKGRPDEVYGGLHDGDAVLSTMLAQRTGLGIGDTIEVETSTTQQKLRVVGVCGDYTLGGMSLCLERAAADRLFGIKGSDIFLVYVAPDAPPETLHQLQTLTEENGLLLQSFVDFTRMLDEIMNGAIGMIWGLLILGFLVAALAMANTLSMNVLEQTREIGLMRAAGMTRGQVHRMVLFQALLMGLVGLPLGALGGSLLAWVISLCLLPLIGHSIAFDLRLTLLAACSAGGLLIVLLAAWFPAIRAARMSVIEAIHTE